MTLFDSAPSPSHKEREHNAPAAFASGGDVDKQQRHSALYSGGDVEEDANVDDHEEEEDEQGEGSRSCSDDDEQSLSHNGSKQHNSSLSLRSSSASSLSSVASSSSCSSSSLRPKESKEFAHDKPARAQDSDLCLRRVEEPEYERKQQSSEEASCKLPAQHHSEEEARFDAFLHWMRMGGAKFPHLTLRRYAKDYRGVHISCDHRHHRTPDTLSLSEQGSSSSASAATACISKGKCLLRIPLAMLITVELAKQCPIGSIIASLPNIGSQAILAVYLLQEKAKGKSSFWSPWLQVLPSSFDTLPLFFTAAEMQQLSGCHELLAKVKSQQKSMRDEYATIVKAVRAAGMDVRFTFDEFVWAALAVGTRVFSLCINNVKTSVLAPLADMMNHAHASESPASWTFDNKKAAFTLTSNALMLDGQPVYESYGVKDNKRFFCSYGFCLEDNPANEISLHVTDRAFESTHPTSTVASSPITLARTFTLRQCYDAALEELMSYLRSTDAPRTLGDDVAAAHVTFTKGVSIDNELSALYALRCATNEQLRLFSTSLEQDQLSLQQLNNSESCFNMRNILVFRIGEKRIFHWLYEFASNGIALLCMPWEEACERIRHVMSVASLHSDRQLQMQLCNVDALHVSMLSYINAILVPLLTERRRASSSTETARRLGSDLDRKLLLNLSHPMEDAETSNRGHSLALQQKRPSLPKLATQTGAQQLARLMNKSPISASSKVEVLPLAASTQSISNSVQQHGPVPFVPFATKILNRSNSSSTSDIQTPQPQHPFSPLLPGLTKTNLKTKDRTQRFQ